MRMGTRLLGALLLVLAPALALWARWLFRSSRRSGDRDYLNLLRGIASESCRMCATGESALSTERETTR